MIHQPVEDLAAEMAHSDRVRVREGDNDSDFGTSPISFGDELVDLTADVLSWLGDERE